MARSLPLLAFPCALWALWACSPLPRESALPKGDFYPPALVSVQAEDGQGLVLGFDEEVRSLEGTYVLEDAQGRSIPGLGAEAQGRDLALSLGIVQVPGAAYRLAGEVEDLRGNRCRFVLEFTGFNSRPPALALSEIRPQKNSSTKAPHRDYIELVALSGGNLGGVELSWLSSTKVLAYRFPAAEVSKGDMVLLHLAPESRPEEVDETGTDLALSGGIDAGPGYRDFWTALGGLSDASGAVLLRQRPAGKALDGLFYADEAKAGPLPEGRLRDLVLALGREGVWKIGEGGPAYGEALSWKPSASKSLLRLAGGGWTVSATGAESPGLPNP